ncbi:9538_t:CDS:2, partial [Funneliformis geosporum]
KDISEFLYKIRDDSVRSRHFLDANNENKIEAILSDYEGPSLHEYIDGEATSARIRKDSTKDRLANDNEPLQVQKDITNSTSEELEKSETQSNTKIILHEVKTNLTEESAILESLQIDSAKDKIKSIAPKSLAPSSIVTEFVQDLLEELLLSGSQSLESLKFSSSKTIVPRFIDIKRFANLFSQVINVRKKLIIAKRAEISS